MATRCATRGDARTRKFEEYQHDLGVLELKVVSQVNRPRVTRAGASAVALGRWVDRARPRAGHVRGAAAPRATLRRRLIE